MRVKRRNKRQLLYQAFMITLSQVQGVTQLLSKGELFISSPRQTTETTWSFCLSIHSWIILCWLQSSLASLSSSSIRSDTVEQFFIHETARCSSLRSPTGLNRTVLCLHLTSHSCHFKAVSLCSADVHHPSFIAAAADCVAWSGLWLHAAAVELAGDRSSHSERLLLTGNCLSVSLIGIKSLPFCQFLNRVQDRGLNGWLRSLGHQCINTLGSTWGLNEVYNIVIREIKDQSCSHSMYLAVMKFHFSIC